MSNYLPVKLGIIGPMKRIAALFVIVSMIPLAWSQKLILPEASSRDDAALTRAFANFAREAFGAGVASDPRAEFLLQLAAGRYQEAVVAATSRRQQLPAGTGPGPSI